MPTKAERDNEAVRLDFERRRATRVHSAFDRRAKKLCAHCGKPQGVHDPFTNAADSVDCPGYKEATK